MTTFGAHAFVWAAEWTADGDPDTLIRDGLAFLRGKSREYGLSAS
jgi:hypothetical protein